MFISKPGRNWREARGTLAQGKLQTLMESSSEKWILHSARGSYGLARTHLDEALAVAQAANDLPVIFWPTLPRLPGPGKISGPGSLPRRLVPSLLGVRVSRG